MPHLQETTHKGVALAAKRLGIKATIVMPKHTPLIKVNATKQYGAEVVLHGEIYDEAYQKAMELQQEKRLCVCSSFDDEDVIEGQGTIALEVLAELPDADVLLVPVGGGGIVSGIAAAAKLKKSSHQSYRCRTRRGSQCFGSIKGQSSCTTRRSGYHC